MNKESNMPMIYTKPEDKIDLEKRYYHGIYILIKFNNILASIVKCRSGRKETDPDQEEM